MAVDNPDDYLSLWQFFSECFVPLQKIQLPLKPAHKRICDELQKALLGQAEKEFIVINIPPRFGKTKLLEASICWMFAYFPDSQFIYTSFSSTLAERSLRYIEEIMEGPWYVELFGSRKGSIWRSDEFKTNANGIAIARGVEGTIIGSGAGLKRQAGGALYIDDANNSADSLSATVLESTCFAFETVLKNRRNSDKWTPIVICAQRLATNDLCGYVLSKYPDKCLHIKVSAIDESGESIYPETMSVASLMETKRVNPFAYAAQYEQNPVAFGGNLIKTDWFPLYTEDPDQLRWERKIITADTALKTKEHNDYSVFQCWGKVAGKMYLLDQARGRWQGPELLQIAVAFWEKHNIVSPYSGMGLSGFYCEDAASGTGLIQTLRRQGIPVIPIIRHKDKVTRVKEVLHYMATGMVHLPKNAPFLQELISELCAFREDGKHEHDDAVDCLVDGVQILGGRKVSIFDAL